MQLNRKYLINEVPKPKVLLVFNTEGICIDMQSNGLFMLPVSRKETIGVNYNDIDLLIPLSEIYSIRYYFSTLNEPKTYEFEYISDKGHYLLSAEIANISNCFLQVSLTNVSGNDYNKCTIPLHNSSKKLINSMLNAYALFRVKDENVIIAENCVFIDVNKKFEEMMETDRDDIIGRNLSDLFPVSFSVLLDKLMYLLNSSQSEYSLFIPELNKHIHLTAFSPVKNFFTVLIRDDTTQKEYLKELVYSNKLHDILAESSFEAIFVFSGNECLACNNVAKELFNFTGKDYSTLNYGILFDSDYVDAVKSRLDESDTAPFIAMAKSLSGKTFPVKVKLTPFLNNGKKLNTFVISDISQLKNTEEDLIEAEERYRNIVDSLCDGVFSSDVSGNLLYINHSFSNLTGISENEIEDLNICDLILPEDVDNIKYQFSNLVYNTYTHEYRIKNPDSDSKWVKIITFPVMENNTVAGFNGVVIDIDSIKKTSEEKVELQNQLMHTQKMEALGVLAGGIAHDFNNILSVIIGYAEISEYEINKTNDVKTALKEIQNAGSRAQALVRQILSFSRKKAEEIDTVMVKPIMKEVVKMLRSSAPATVRIISDIREDSMILAEPTKIHQIIMNLCTNSLYAVNNDSGEIRVSLKETDLHNVPVSCKLDMENNFHDNFSDYTEKVLEIKVSDNGCGIPEENIKKVLEPYFTTKPVDEGTGLGLSIVHTIVKSFNGAMHIGSTVNKGTAIRIFFPICKQSGESEIINSREPVYLNNMKIMYIDDEPSLGYIFKKQMVKAGCSVFYFENPCLAFSEIMDNRVSYDLIVSNISMPEMTGYQLYENLRNNNISIPIIFCTGYHDKIHEHYSIKKEIPKTITKPINFKSLLYYIKNINLNKKILS